MDGRTYSLIFFVWAALTIITPTLILLSASSKPEDTDGLLSEAVKLRRLRITLNPKYAEPSVTSARGTNSTAYGRDLGFWDLVSSLMSFWTKQESQIILDDPSDGLAA